MDNPTPKCLSRLGHKFQPRYDSYLPAHITHMRARGWDEPTDMMEAAKTKMYRGDVCVRCGCIVNLQKSGS